MIGSKKLSTIREELRCALAATGEDPIRWLEERLTATERQGVAPPAQSEVMHSLLRLLEGRKRSRRPRKPVRTKK